MVVVNGHGKKKEYHVGLTKAHLKKDIEDTNIKVESIKSLGQKTVDVQPDDNLDIEFNIKVNDSDVFIFNNHCSGYQFLRDKFQSQVDDFEQKRDAGFDR